MKQNSAHGHQQPEDNSSSGKQRTTRWAPPTTQYEVCGFPTAITTTMSAEQLDAYVAEFRIQEIGQKLKMEDIVPTNRDRSPSLEPEYDNSGRRTNTRKQRYRKRLEDERHQLIETAVNTIPGYRLPPDYRRPGLFRDKIFIPTTDFPGVNFIGQILGPRGSSLKAMNLESGATIVIRGRGSVKEGKGRAIGDQSEPLHCLITGNSQHKVKQARKLVQNVIEAAISTPEKENKRKQQQLRDLAKLNGTFRDDEAQSTYDYGSRLITCVDCTSSMRHSSTVASPSVPTAESTIDREISQLMSEISEANSGATNDLSRQEITRLPPWRVDWYRKKGWMN